MAANYGPAWPGIATLLASEGGHLQDVCYEYQNGKTIRKIAKEMELSAIKVRKILITGGVFTSDLSTQIDALYKDGKKPAEIAEILNTTI